MGVLLAATADVVVAGVGRGAVVATKDASYVLVAGEDDDKVVAVACSADGSQVVTASTSKVLRCWVGGEVAGEGLAPRRPSSLAVAAYRGGTCCLAACAGDLVALPLPSLDAAGACLGHTSSVLTNVAVSPDGTRVATCDRNEKVRVSRFPQCAVIETFLLGHTKFVTSCAFLDDARVASCGGDGTVRLWDAASGASRGVARPTLPPVEDAADAAPPPPPADDDASAATAKGDAMATCLAAHASGFVVVGLEGASALFVYRGPGLDDASTVPLPAPPVDVCFHGTRLLALVQRADEAGGLLCDFEPAGATFVPAAAKSAAATALEAAAAAARGALGPVAASAFLQAVEERTHANMLENSNGKPSILKKHALDTKFDSSAFADCSSKLSSKAPRNS